MGYYGSKATSGLCQTIIAMMPPHVTYIETHLGGGAIMLQMALSGQLYAETGE
jgi:site-specific DNA-adenine methylase